MSFLWQRTLVQSSTKIRYNRSSKSNSSAIKKLSLGQELGPGVIDSAMGSTIKLFQSQNTAAAGKPLKVDGITGRFTCMAFRAVTITSFCTTSHLCSTSDSSDCIATGCNEVARSSEPWSAS
jgi:hypothetical protein